MRRPFSKEPHIEKSLNHSVRDATAHAVMSGAGESYFAAFALFLKATTGQIALLASIPPLLASLAQLLSVWCARRIKNRKSIILIGAYAQCLLWLPLLALPLLFPDDAVPLFIGLIILYQASGQFIAPQWSSLMGDLVPRRKRGRYFGMRNRFSTVTSFLSLVIAGSLLHWFDSRGETLYGFIAIFIVAAVARLISAYHIHRMYEPPRAVEPASVAFNVQAWKRRLRSSAAVRFSIYYAALQACVSISAPFFTVYMLRDLHFSYMEFTIITATSVLAHFLSLRTWGRISDVWGNRVILAFTGTVITCLPALWMISSNFGYLIAAQLLSGMCWSGFGLATTNYLFDSVPEEKRSQYMAFHHMLTAIGVFAGALLGGLIATSLPTEMTLFGHHYSWSTAIFGVFLISSLARVAVAYAFLPYLREVREVRKAPLSISFLHVGRVARRGVRSLLSARRWLDERTLVVLRLYARNKIKV